MDAPNQARRSSKFYMVLLLLVPAVIAAVAILLNIVRLNYAESLPGRYGQDLEIRLLAIDSSQLLPDEKLAGADILPAADEAKLVNGGEAPAGWRWLPVDDAIDASDTLRKLSVHQMQDNHLFALVADRPENIMTHGTNLGHWGIKSAKVTESSDGNETRVFVEVLLDTKGARLLTDLSARNVQHYLAIVVAGRIIMAPRVNDPIGDRFEISLGAPVPDLPPGDTAQVDRDEREIKLAKLWSKAKLLQSQIAR